MKKIRKERKKRNINVFITTGVIALAFSIIGYGLMLSSENAVLGKYDRSDVYIMTDNIAAGTQISKDNVEKYFKPKSIDTEVVPAGAVTELKKLVGTYAKYDLSKNMVITEKMFQDINSVVVGDKEIGINIANLSGSVNGILRASDYIDIYIVPNNYQDYLKDKENEDAIQGDGSYIIDGEIVSGEDLLDGSMTEEPAAETGGETEEPGKTGVTTNAVPIAPSYEHIYVQKVFDNDGEIIENSDGVSIASRFNIILPSADADYLIGAIQTGAVYIVLCRD